MGDDVVDLLIGEHARETGHEGTRATLLHDRAEGFGGPTLPELAVAEVSRRRREPTRHRSVATTLGAMAGRAAELVGRFAFARVSGPDDGRKEKRPDHEPLNGSSHRLPCVICLAQLDQPAARIEGRQLLESADRGPVDEDLRHRPATRAPDDVITEHVVGTEIELGIRDAPRREETLGALAERARLGAVDLDADHIEKARLAASYKQDPRVDRLGTRRYGRSMADPRVAERFSRLVDLMARLRGPQGCPWDREQTPESLRPYLLEEVYEVLEAIEGGQASALCDELGDLLLQIVFQSQLAAEAGRFTIADVSRSITDKLVRRHPHVFADVQVRDAQEVIHNWGRIKDEERKAKGEVGILAGVPRTLPALVRAQQVDEKVARASGQRTEGRDVIGHLRQHQTELEAAVAAGDRASTERELGALLFSIARLAHHLDLSAEIALRSVTERFIAHVEHLEGAARKRGATLAELDPAELAPLRRAPGASRAD